MSAAMAIGYAAVSAPREQPRDYFFAAGFLGAGFFAGAAGFLATAAAGAFAFAGALAAFGSGDFLRVSDFTGFGRLALASSASRMSLSASSCVIWPRRTMYWTRSRALSMAKPARPTAALITSFIAAPTLVPASRLISCALAAISATVSRTSAPRWPGGRRGAG